MAIGFMSFGGMLTSDGKKTEVEESSAQIQENKNIHEDNAEKSKNTAYVDLKENK